MSFKPKEPLFLTSPHNPRVKTALKLKNNKHRQEANLITVEGAREIRCALSSGFELDELFYAPELLSEASQKILSEQKNLQGLIAVSTNVFEKLAMREGSDGLFAIFHRKIVQPSQIKLSANPLALIVEGVEKPGNLGAILRTADGAGVELVIVIGRSVDPFNPNCIRASLGGIFTVPVFVTDNEGAKKLCAQFRLQTIAASPDAKINYFNVDFKKPTAIVLGSEAFGLSKEWLETSNQTVKIPMLGKIDSLNVSVASAVMLYEAQRQRLV